MGFMGFMGFLDCSCALGVEDIGRVGNWGKELFN
jgi:hypothetical protein